MSLDPIFLTCHVGGLVVRIKLKALQTWPVTCLVLHRQWLFIPVLKEPSVQL